MANGRFGTDGVRGLANRDLTPEIALALGRAAVRVLGSSRFYVGADTRRSSSLLVSALSAGLASEGADVVDLGVVPTPGVAAICSYEHAPGAVVSASHNPFFDNGIKIFGIGGLKLSDDRERAIEEELERIISDPGAPDDRPIGDRVGTITRDATDIDRYVEHLSSSLGEGSLHPMRLVVDCAHGAASPVAEQVLRALGADVVLVGAEPDGANINDAVGSTHPELLQRAVVEHHADLGLALDGDADRLVAVDHTGTVLDGDVLLALFALDLKARGQLASDAVVVTVMTNLGFYRAMSDAGISVRQVAVGDRYVLSALEAEDLTLGGEQSGHVIFRRLSTTGDGLLTGILLADVVNRSGKTLAELAAGSVTLLPQTLVAVPTGSNTSLDDAKDLWARVEELTASLRGRGRILVRESGTEPVVRVMVEADDPDDAAAITDELVELVARSVGTPTSKEVQ